MRHDYFNHIATEHSESLGVVLGCQLCRLQIYFYLLFDMPCGTCRIAGGLMMRLKSNKCKQWLQWDMIILNTSQLNIVKVWVVAEDTRTLRFSYATFSLQRGLNSLRYQIKATNCI